MQKKELEIILQNLTAQISSLLGDKLDRVALYGSCARGDNIDDFHRSRFIK